MASFQDARDGLGALLKDGARSLSPADVVEVVKTSARTFQRKFPRVLAVELAGNGGFDYPLSGVTGYVDGFSSIQKVYYPYLTTDQNPPALEPKDWRIWDAPAGAQLRFLNDSPGAAEKALVVFTAPHTVDPQLKVKAVLSAAGTVVAGPATSGADALVESTGAAQVYLHVTALAPAATLDVFIEQSEDRLRWTRLGAFNAVDAVGDYVLALPAERVGRYIRLAYVPSGGAATVEAVVGYEDTQGTLTVPDHHMDLFLYLCAATACRALADYFAQLSHSELPGDTTDYEGKSSFWRENAAAWEEKWDKEAKAAGRPRGSSAFAQGEWDIMGKGGWEYMHSRSDTR